jgi:trimeric autotransporter adhesin
MSTKTTIKRIALVAAVAAAFGGLSTVAANAAGTAHYLGNQTAAVTIPTATAWIDSADELFCSQSLQGSSTGSSTCTGAVGGQVTVNWVPVTADSATAVTVTVSNATILGAADSSSSTTAVAYKDGVDFAQGVTYTSGSTSRGVQLVLTSATAGTSTVSVTSTNSTTGAVTTVTSGTITWSSQTLAPSVGYSTVYAAGSTTTPTSATSIGTQSDATGTQRGNIAVAVYDQNDSAMVGQTISATIAGPGLISIASGTSTTGTGNARVASVTLTGSTNQAEVYVNGDGTAGVGTITITDGTTTLGTATVTFAGSPAAVSAVQNLKVLAAGDVATASEASSANVGDLYYGVKDQALSSIDTVANTSSTDGTPEIVANVVDANGVSVADTTGVKSVSSNTAILNGGTCTLVTNTASIASSAADYNKAGIYNCPVTATAAALSGQSATITIEAYDATTAAYDFLSKPLTFTIGGAIAQEVLTTDSATYTPLQPITLTVTATDSKGNPVYDQDVASTVKSAVASSMLGGATLAATVGAASSFIGGVVTYTGIYAPSAEGDFTISGTDPNSASLEAISATATVAGGAATTAASAATDAANEATDAANAATDAANAAADSADAATQAAQDAGDKADAALAAVTALSQQVTTLLAKVAALSATIAKIAKKLKA